MPLSAERRQERDDLVERIVVAARTLVEKCLVRCTDFAFEQRVEVRKPVPDRPGVFSCKEAKTLAPDAAWAEVHAEGAYRMELCLSVQQEERGAMVLAKAPERTVDLVPLPRRRRRRRRSRSIVTREDLARVFASFRRAEVPEERDVCAAEK